VLKLNLASGTDLRGAPWINLDAVERWPGTSRGCDVVWDATRDRIPFPDGSVDEVYAGYLLLHVPPRYHAGLLLDIKRVCAPGARLVFSEVDFAVVMPRWLAKPDDKQLSELIWGEQGDIHGADLSDWDKHCWGFTEEKLVGTLVRAGFREPRRISIHASGVFYELTIEVRKGI
jgi:SAM-dependent methyltransferase